MMQVILAATGLQWDHMLAAARAQDKVRDAGTHAQDAARYSMAKAGYVRVEILPTVGGYAVRDVNSHDVLYSHPSKGHVVAWAHGWYDVAPDRREVLMDFHQ